MLSQNRSPSRGFDNERQTCDLQLSSRLKLFFTFFNCKIYIT